MFIYPLSVFDTHLLAITHTFVCNVLLHNTKGPVMTLKHLEIFKEVYKENSITRAAENLNMAQPAVSNYIKELENYYGCNLFERMNRRIYRTGYAGYLYEHTTEIFSHLDMAKKGLTSHMSYSSIFIGSNMMYGEEFLAEVLEKFSKDNPDISIRCRIGNNNSIENMLLNNEIDIGFIDYAPDVSSLITKQVVKEKIIVVATPQYIKKHRITELTLKELSDQPLLLREKGSGLRNTIDEIFHYNGLTPQNVLAESVSLTALVNLCMKNFGLFISTETFAKTFIQEKKLHVIPIVNMQLTRSYYAAYHKNKFLRPELLNFIREL